MSQPPPPGPTLFDSYAAHYDAALDRGIAVSGETKEYFAEQRVLWLAQRLRSGGMQPEAVLDFGCGVGTSLPFLGAQLGPARLAGFDVSSEALKVARQHLPEHVTLSDDMETWPDGSIDLVFTSGVFHHIAPEARGTALRTLHRVLRPGGCLALWENNPWNPGTRYVMSRIPFDRDAVLVYPHTARKFLVDAGFRTAPTDFIFIFPRALSLLRPLEPMLARWPLGAQFLQLAWRPDY